MLRIESVGSKGRWGIAILMLTATIGLFGCGPGETESTPSATTTSDTIAPSTPIGLTAAAVSPSQINLNWTASTDNVAVTGYRVYRGDALLVTLGNVTTYQNIGLTASTTYSYTVQAIDGATNVSAQSTAAIATTPATIDTTAPSTPTGLSANAVSPSQINLSWTASTDNVAVTGYRVFRGGALLTTLGNVTTFQDTGLTASTTYTYTVRALDAAGNVSGASTAASATTTFTDTTAPSTPTGLTTIAASPSQINLSWTASTDNVAVTGYRVYRDGTLLVTLGNVTTYQNTGLTALTTYSYTVRALDAAGNVSGASAAASATTLAIPDTTPPTTPTGLTANAVSPSQINLGWTASTDNVAVTGYRVYRGGTLLVTLGNVTTYQNTGLTALTTYTYTVRSLDAAGNVSGTSAAASATTLAIPDTTPPTIPTGLTATTVSSSRIRLSWSASTDNVAVSGYRVYRNGVFITNVGIATTFENTGLTPSTTYTYNVDAIDAAGNASGASTAASATTMAFNTATLAWDAVTASNLAGYRIYYGTVPGTYFQSVGAGVNVGNLTTYTVTGLGSGTRYYFAVAAYSTSNVESVFSNEVVKDIP